MTSRSILLLSFIVTIFSLLIQPSHCRGHGGRITITNTTGSGGVECGNGVCLKNDNVTCQKGKCQCGDKFHRGDGLIVCSCPGWSVCQVVSDPMVIAYSGELVNVPAMCKFLMSTLETKAKDPNGRMVGECIVEASAWSIKGRGRGRRGKQFVGGMEIQFTVLVGGQIYYHAARIYGHVRNGRYTFFEQGNDSPMASGVWGHSITTYVAGVGVIHTVYDYSNNIAEVRADFCGVRMGFRPQEIVKDKKNTPQMAPGVYIKVDEACEPNYLSSESALCLAPPKHKITLKDYIDKLEAEHGIRPSKKEAMMFRILKGSANQNFPGAAPRLQALANLAQECTDKFLLHAMRHCIFISEHSKFLKCWTRTGRGRGQGQGQGRGQGQGQGQGQGGDMTPEEEEEEEEEKMNELLLLLHSCVSSFCGHSSLMCNIVQESISKSRCLQRMPRRGYHIMNFSCSSLVAQA